jgi:hypothetical protein
MYYWLILLAYLRRITSFRRDVFANVRERMNNHARKPATRTTPTVEPTPIPALAPVESSLLLPLLDNEFGGVLVVVEVLWLDPEPPVLILVLVVDVVLVDSNAIPDPVSQHAV